MIYMDNAATTAVRKEVAEAMLPYLLGDYGNPSGVYRLSEKAKNVVEESRDIIADIINADRNEIFFTSGGTEGDNWAVKAESLKRKQGHIIVSSIEHHAVTESALWLKNYGIDVTFAPVDEQGIVKLEQLEKMIRNDTFLVSVMLANNEIGTIQPIAEIGKICKEKGVIFHTDAVQAAGHLHIDVNKENIDMLSLSGHKFHGPKGVGVLFARKNIPLVNIIEGGAQERGRRAGTENLPAIVGMAKALMDATKAIDETAEIEIKLRNHLIEGLEKISHSILNGDREKRLPGNVNFCFEGIEGESLLLLLDAKGIAASSGSACTSGSLDPSHVLLAIGRPHEIAHGSLRLTICRDNTMEEIDYMIKEIANVVEYLRGISPVWDELEKGEIKHII